MKAVQKLGGGGGVQVALDENGASAEIDPSKSPGGIKMLEVWGLFLKGECASQC